MKGLKYEVKALTFPVGDRETGQGFEKGRIKVRCD